LFPATLVRLSAVRVECGCSAESLTSVAGCRDR
jgi:hypothetical protein